mmetsp:Transcript_29944/g.86849  ORF Transcript_29944/g.86849 Transcript_29944/m.86849 type:complete len:202 (-) Transcript_29944:25-630(-)
MHATHNLNILHGGWLAVGQVSVLEPARQLPQVLRVQRRHHRRADQPRHRRRHQTNGQLRSAVLDGRGSGHHGEVHSVGLDVRPGRRGALRVAAADKGHAHTHTHAHAERQRRGITDRAVLDVHRAAISSLTQLRQSGYPKHSDKAKKGRKTSNRMVRADQRERGAARGRGGWERDGRAEGGQVAKCGVTLVTCPSGVSTRR